MRSVDRPVNVLGRPEGNDAASCTPLSTESGHITVESGLSHAALGGFLRTAREMKQSGTSRGRTVQRGSLTDPNAKLVR